MDVPARPGDVLAQPTRARLFAALGELRRPASTEELAARLGLHANGIRVHLERLRSAGLVERERRRQARGRPLDVWSINAEAYPGGEPPTAYVDLSRWLVRTLVETRTSVREVEAAGRRIGRDIARGGHSGSPEEHFHAALVAMGFQPLRERTPAGTMTYCLRNCPYRDIVRERQPLVCGLHRGLTRGMLDAIDPRTKLGGFVPKDPDTAGCLIELRGPPAEEPAA